MITGISPNSYHLQANAQHDRLANLSEPQKEVWKDFLSENKSTTSLGGEDNSSKLELYPSLNRLNLFTFNPCRCGSFEKEMYSPSGETLGEEHRLFPVENDSMTQEPSRTNESYPSDEDRMPELILDSSLDSDTQGVEERAPDAAEMAAQEMLTIIAENPNAAIDKLLSIWGPEIEVTNGDVSQLGTALRLADAETLLAAYEAESLEALNAILGTESTTEMANPLDLDSMDQPAEKTDAPSAIFPISDSKMNNLVNYANAHLAEDSPMTSEWLTTHLGVARLISAFPDFASYLNENSDLAINFMKGIEEVKSTLKDFFNETVVEKASELLSDDSRITDEWLANNLNAAHLIANQPTFAAYLDENIEQADKFISFSV